MSTSTDRAVVLLLSWLGGLAGHYSGDYLVQRDCDAQRKQERNAAGRRALLRHVVTYALSLAGTRAVAFRVARTRVPLRAQVIAAVVEAVLHALIDDGRLLRRYAELVGKTRFHELADQGINGRSLLDQAAHLGVQLPIGAAMTAVVAGLATSSAGALDLVPAPEPA